MVRTQTKEKVVIGLMIILITGEEIGPMELMEENEFFDKYIFRISKEA